MERPVGGIRDAFLVGEIRVGDVAEDFFAVALGQGDVDDGGLAAELDVFDGECGRAGLCPSEEFEVEGEGVGLLLMF